MNATYKPRFEMLEDRQLLTADLTSVAIDPVITKLGIATSSGTDFGPSDAGVPQVLTAADADPVPYLPFWPVPARPPCDCKYFTITLTNARSELAPLTDLAIGDTDANQSNQGWGPWETNVAKVLSQDAAGVADAGRITAIAVDSSDSGTQDPTPLIAIALCRNEVIDEVFRFEVAKDADPAIVRPAEFVVLSNPS